MRGFTSPGPGESLPLGLGPRVDSVKPTGRGRARLSREDQLPARDHEHDAERFEDHAARQALHAEGGADERAEYGGAEVDRQLGRQAPHGGEVAEKAEDRVAKDEGDGNARGVARRRPAPED